MLELVFRFDFEVGSIFSKFFKVGLEIGKKRVMECVSFVSIYGRVD